MAHFALINNQNKVIFVTPVANDKITINEIELEEKGIDFLFNTIKIQNIYTDAITTRQTSYNSGFRNKYAGIGDEWDEENNLFRSPKPFESWVLSEDKSCYEAPTPMPSEGAWHWSEEELKWIEIKTDKL